MRRSAHQALIAITLSLAPISVAAQPPAPAEPLPTQGVVKKGKVPVSNEILKIKLPKPVEVDLPNGLHLMVLEDHRLPQLSFQIFIPGAGGYYDPGDQPGLASFVAALMREGTASRTSEQISQQLEVMAASLTVGAGAGLEAGVNGSSLTDQFDKLLDIAADVLLHPAFPEEELARFKQRTRAQLTQQRANPGFLAAELFNRVIYGTHPASRISPTVAALEAVTRDALASFHRTRYVPDHAGMAIAGDISPADARQRNGSPFLPAPVLATRPLATRASNARWTVDRLDPVKATRSSIGSDWAGPAARILSRFASARRWATATVSPSGT